MATLFIGGVAFAVSLLTLFSGFGLGTLLLPAFALFFSVEVAVAATALVHGANSFFKLAILGRDIDRAILLRFGLPAIGAALVGAYVLTLLSGREPIYALEMRGERMEVTPVELVMGIMILGFALFELVPRLRKLRAPTRWLPLGGAMSGFFGGLSGHQGALRAAFLTPLGLTPAAFAATQAGIASMVDASRLTVYGVAFLAGTLVGPSTPSQWGAVGFAAVCAFGGALLGKRLLHRATMAGVRVLTGTLLLVVGVGLLTGII
jgi:uncharacterized membrane protein YfcA